jgi:predicted transglutaminase-like cysteine proteinase
MRRTHLVLALAFLALAIAGIDAEARQAGGDAFVYPRLFGTAEVHSSAIDRFYKWTGMLQRWERARTAALQPCAPGQLDGCEPQEWRRIVATLAPLDTRAKLDAVNALVNRYPYIPSAVNWREPNYWETPYEFLSHSGQCQDYAIAKFMALRAAGVPNEQLRLVVVRDTRLGQDHAVLVAYVDGKALMLDNQIADVVPVESVQHYRPYYSINETGWWLHEPNPLQISAALH